MEVVDRGIEGVTGEKLNLRLTIGDVDILDLVLLKKFKNILSAVESGIAAGAVGKDANPNGCETGNCLAVAALSLFFPSETGKIDRGVLDVFQVEELGRLQRDISPENC